MVSWTKSREPAVQSWPELYRMPSATQFAATFFFAGEGILLSLVSSPNRARPHTRTLVEVGRLEDDLRRLATELEADLQSCLSPRPWKSQPWSNRTFFRLLFAAASMIFRPVTVLPVNATLSTSRCIESAAPPTEPSDGTVFTTPGGNLCDSEEGAGTSCGCVGRWCGCGCE